MKDRIEVIRLSDNLLRPEKWVAEINKHPTGRVEWAIQFVGQDERNPATWRDTATIRTARKAIKSAIKLHLQAAALGARP